MTIYGLQMDGSYEDTLRAKLMRAALGAFYGFLAGAAFVFVGGFIDLWLHPELPLGVDWPLFWARLPLVALGLALVGAVTCVLNEAWQGLLLGAAVASALALIVALFAGSEVTTGMKLVVLIFILVPIAAMTVPLVWILRWLMERHTRALRLDSSYARIAALILIAALLGGAGGYFLKKPGREIQVIAHMHALLQNPQLEKSPIPDVSGMAEHQGMSYTLYSAKSETSTEGFDMRAEFEDGYLLKCTGVKYPERSPYISACSSE